jgi:hypothetical protein
LEQSPADVDTLLREQRARYETALGALRKISPRKFDKNLKRLQEAARLTRLREGARSEGIRFFGLSRTFALRAGTLCDLGDDIFFLEHEEILDLLEEQDEATAHIPLRKTAYQKFVALPQYPTVILGHFDPDAWMPGLPTPTAGGISTTQAGVSRDNGHLNSQDCLGPLGRLKVGCASWTPPRPAPSYNPEKSW